MENSKSGSSSQIRVQTHKQWMETKIFSPFSIFGGRDAVVFVVHIFLIALLREQLYLRELVVRDVLADAENTLSSLC